MSESSHDIFLLDLFCDGLFGGGHGGTGLIDHLVDTTTVPANRFPMRCFRWLAMITRPAGRPPSKRGLTSKDTQSASDQGPCPITRISIELTNDQTLKELAQRTEDRLSLVGEPLLD